MLIFYVQKPFLEQMEKLKRIGGLIPTTEDLDRFNKWKKRKIRSSLYGLLSLMLLFSFLGILFYEAGEFNIETFEDVFGIFFCFVMVFIGCFIVINGLRNSLGCTLEYFNYGKIIEKYDNLFQSGNYKTTNINRNKRDKTHHIIVKVKEIEVDVVVNSDEYRKLNLNDEVFIFVTNEERIYVLKK